MKRSRSRASRGGMGTGTAPWEHEAQKADRNSGLVGDQHGFTAFEVKTPVARAMRS